MPIDPTVITDVGVLVAAVILAVVASALAARLFIRASSGAPRRDRTTTSLRDDSEGGSGDA